MDKNIATIPSAGNHDMDKLEFSLPQDAKTQFKLIRLTGFRKTDFQRVIRYIPFDPNHDF